MIDFLGVIPALCNLRALITKSGWQHHSCCYCDCQSGVDCSTCITAADFLFICSDSQPLLPKPQKPKTPPTLHPEPLISECRSQDRGTTIPREPLLRSLQVQGDVGALMILTMDLGQSAVGLS